MKNVNKCLLIGIALVNIVATELQAQQNWAIKPVTILTRWAKSVSPINALKEYPRPQLVRSEWTNLNGLWNYIITSKGESQPANWDGQILVPYPLESALSGVQKTLKPDQNLWYQRSFTKPAAQKGDKVFLNFGAVDYEATVFINGTQVGQHEGGYTAFTVDITSALKEGNNELVVKVFDPTGEGVGPHGKQVLNPANIYYTPTSGIWQTVWMEVVPEAHIEGLVMTPDVDKGVLALTVNLAGLPKGVTVEAEVLNANMGVASLQKAPRNDATSTVIARTRSDEATPNLQSTALSLPIPNAKLWSPGSPFLYDLVVRLKKDGKVIDEVKSYFGMRKISIGKDSKGVDRIMLNNKPYFNLGTLDQGFWPDGLYTAPTDDALAWDIKAIKAMGFNTIRKHIKVEPARWYYHADKIGMLVWQDFVQPNPSLPAGAKEIFEKQGAEMMSQLHNYPSIVTWVLFNEKWGQYDQERLTSWVKKTDPSRIVNGHSGEILYVNEKLRSPSPNAYVNSDMTDVHAYPDPMNSLSMPGKARVCGEFGGIGVFIPDHQWNTSSAWGYINEKPAAFKAKYTVMNQHLKLFEAEGLSGSIYTQPFDVEGEQNGIMTYDREVVKIPFAELRKIHSALNPDLHDQEILLRRAPKCGSRQGDDFLEMTGEVKAKNADLTEPAQVYADAVAEYMIKYSSLSRGDISPQGGERSKMLKKLVMMAGQTNDLAGKARFGNEYMATLKEPYSVEDMTFIEGMTKKVTDKGFAVLMDKAKADRIAYVKVMNIVYADVIAPFVPDGKAKPDWTAVEAAVKPYGLPGEEILLRAKTIHLYNQQDWAGYVVTATAYLAKYGANIPENEKVMFKKAVEDHK